MAKLHGDANISTKEAPIWGRPNLRPSTLYIPTGDHNKRPPAFVTRHGGGNSMPGTDTEAKMMGSAGRGSDLEGSIRAAMEVPMFPSSSFGISFLHS